MARKAKPRVESLVSAGGVVYREAEGLIETVLCGRTVALGTSRDGEEGQVLGSRSRGEEVRWSLAKGTPDVGETLEETALREVREETGLEVQLESSIGSIVYWFADRGSSVRFHKTVHFYLMVPVGGDTGLHDPEFDVVQWFHFDKALDALTYPNEAGVLRRARDLIARHRGDR